MRKSVLWIIHCDLKRKYVCDVLLSVLLHCLSRFFKSRPNMDEFLQKLLHFQHFRQFINSKIDKLKRRNIERDLFDNEVLAYEEGKC